MQHATCNMQHATCKCEVSNRHNMLLLLYGRMADEIIMSKGNYQLSNHQMTKLNIITHRNNRI